MKAVALLAGATAVVTTLSFPAFAQTEISAGANVSGVSEVNDRLDDIQDAVEDDFARSGDVDRFGPQDRRQGLFGGAALATLAVFDIEDSNRAVADPDDDTGLAADVAGHPDMTRNMVRTDPHPVAGQVGAATGHVAAARCARPRQRHVRPGEIIIVSLTLMRRVSVRPGMRLSSRRHRYRQPIIRPQTSGSNTISFRI